MKYLNSLLILFVITLLLLLEPNPFQENLENFLYAQIYLPYQQMTLAQTPPKPEKPDLNLDLESAISFKVNKGRRETIIFEKDIEKGLAIASLTKLMTALIVLENTPEDDYNFRKTTVISEIAESQGDVPVYGNLKQGQVFTIEKLLELTLIYSSNDAAFALSEVVDQKRFIEKMNQKVQSLNLKNTHFINPTGLDPKNEHQLPNYSTAEDLVTLTRYIIDNYPLIFEISLRKGPYEIHNGLKSLKLLSNQKFIGGKTGYTYKAGGCMIMIFKDEKGSHFINIVLGAYSPETRVQEMQKLINWINL